MRDAPSPLRGFGGASGPVLVRRSFSEGGGELQWLSAAEAAQAIADKELSPVELMKALLDRIAKLDPRLNAFITLDAEAAMAAAKAAEAEAVAGRLPGPE